MIGVVGAAWGLSLGFDFFLHAGLLLKFYVEASPFILPPEVALRRIPLGYLSFLVLTLSLYWLFRRLGTRGVASGDSATAASLARRLGRPDARPVFDQHRGMAASRRLVDWPGGRAGARRRRAWSGCRRRLPQAHLDHGGAGRVHLYRWDLRPAESGDAPSGETGPMRQHRRIASPQVLGKPVASAAAEKPAPGRPARLLGDGLSTRTSWSVCGACWYREEPVRTCGGECMPSSSRASRRVWRETTLSASVSRALR